MNWPPEAAERKLACVARLGVEHKGQDLLVEALSHPMWADRSITVTLFGRGHDEVYLKRLIETLSCSKVQIGGYVNGIDAIWRDHHALVLPSRYEGLPVALVEAMLCGRPAIVTDVGGNSELVVEGITGFVASQPCVTSLQNALARAWDSRRSLQELGLAARQHVLQTIPKAFRRF